MFDYWKKKKVIIKRKSYVRIIFKILPRARLNVRQYVRSLMSKFRQVWRQWPKRHCSGCNQKEMKDLYSRGISTGSCVDGLQWIVRDSYAGGRQPGGVESRRAGRRKSAVGRCGHCSHRGRVSDGVGRGHGSAALYCRSSQRGGGG